MALKYSSLGMKPLAILSVIILVATTAAFDGSNHKPPNIVVIVADDMGYGDLGCMGSQTIRTPHLDGVAKSGVRCSQAYVASAVCSPSRAGFMTGRDPRRFGYEGNLNAASANYSTRPALLGLPPHEKTIGDQLRAAGYATAIIGKWHLGIGPDFHPNNRGFTYFCGMLGGGHDYFPERVEHRIERNGRRVESFSSPYLTDFFTDEGLRFLDSQHQKAPEQPWLIIFSYNAPHTPMQATEEDLARFSHIPNKRRQTYAAMIFALDRGVGRIRQYLESTGQWENTLLVFFSDNGGATNNASWNGPLRGTKGCLREGGIRVPMLWSWPNQLAAGSECRSVVSALDLVPTFLATAGRSPLPLSPPMSHEDARNRRRMVQAYGEYDGRNVLPQLTDLTSTPPRKLFWRLQGQAAMLEGNEKMIRLSHRPAQMFRPMSDVGESADLVATDPKRFQDLFRTLGEWESTLPTVPLWGSSPFWNGESAQQYDGWEVRPEPHID